MMVKDYVEGHTNAKKEAELLQRHHPKLQISQRSVLRMWKIYLALSSEIADKNTLALIRAQGYILLALDGQRPEAGHKSLWYFLDVASDRVLHTAYLDVADTPTLKRILKLIQRKYGVSIKAVVSDHQKSILTAIQEALPKAKHQACHFHFLKNLWRSLAAIDTHLQKILSTAVNGLYINRIAGSRRAVNSGKKGESIRDFFVPIMQDLKLAVGKECKAFDQWGGVPAYEDIKHAVKELHLLYEKAHQPWEKTIIQKSISALNAALAEARPFYDRLQCLIPRFDKLREILGHAYPTKDAMKTAARQWLADQKAFLQQHNADQPDSNRRIKRLTYKTSVEAIVDQWICLYNSHEGGLFTFMSVEGLPRTNVGMEQDFGAENRFFRFHYGQLKVGYNVRVYGGAVLRLLKSYDPEKIGQMFCELERGGGLKELDAFQARSRQERKQRNSEKNRDPWAGFKIVADRLQLC